jgi:hypothetical protein
MTVGKDVSMLFPDVVNCMQTDDLELKKLVYLYLINYAKTQPDLAIMAVNTFVKARPGAPPRPGRARAPPRAPAPTRRRRRRRAGLAGPEPAHPRAGGAHDGLHPRGQDHRVPVRPAAALPEGAARAPCGGPPPLRHCGARLERGGEARSRQVTARPTTT